eukprot:CAMPEP_0198499172 /NCGR_PEP_ID=MMETSP1462-20131121/7453_1 /TAXON_ID=1333877 /ORGANISM="Brandtodinium nutriculum, Strain RCC3387" /LENGTH=233 /DNA_ID=CAMNT_0044228131 /DNA_START=1 /DNA_END=699 /DNA_ORIENTATION=+
MIDTIIFDIDDTLYPSSCGFSEHRMGEVTRDFMVERLGFKSGEEAMTLWAEYMKRYHSTLKGLTVAMEEGRLPKPFRQEELGQYWAKNCDYGRFVKEDPELVEMMRTLRSEANLTLVAFTNAPRAYAVACLEHLRIREFFPDEVIFAVEDVMPACKPEKAAFDQVLRAVGAAPERTVMFEDSMKNVRACHQLGIHTVLIAEDIKAPSGEAELVGDVADVTDPAVGAVLPSASA